MAFTPSFIGRTTFSNATLAQIPTGNIAVGTRILIAFCIDAPDWDDITDTQSNSGFNGQPVTGNVYGQRSGEAHPNGTCGVWFVTCDSTTVQLRGGGTRDQLQLSRAAGMTGSMAALSATGLTSGVMDSGSTLFGSDTTPIVGLGPIPANDYLIGILGVVGPSSDGFTQDPTFINPGNFNSQTTTSFSVYAGYKQLLTAQSNPRWQPTLGVARDYVGVLLALEP